MTENEPMSPVCFANEASKAYRGIAETAEIVARLDELLEAERAGALVAFETAAEVTDQGRSDLIGVIHRDEGRWCSMLARELRRLGAPRSRNVGAFHGKAMAIADIDERLSFLNRGQAWVVRRLEDLLPRLEEGQLRANLTDMRDAHLRNIEATRRLLEDATASPVENRAP